MASHKIYYQGTDGQIHFSEVREPYEKNPEGFFCSHEAARRDAIARARKHLEEAKTAFDATLALPKH